MGALLIYLIKSSLMLALSVVLFMLLMRRETFHGVNRVLLLAVVLLSLLFPVVEWEVNTPMARVMGSVEQMVISADATVAVGQPLAVAVDAPTDASPNGGEQTGVLHYIMYIYLAGVLMLAVRLIYMYIQVACLVRRGKHEDASPYTTQRLRLMVHEGDSRPFSWFGIVSISRTDLAEAGSEIIMHEAAHIRRGHSWDVLFADLVVIMHWFNPLAWVMKDMLKDIHEYEADSAVLAAGVDAVDYQLLIIKKAVGARLYSIANCFNHSITKKRVIMMCKEKSSVWHIAKVLYVVPLAVLAACTFSSPKSEEPAVKAAENEVAEVKIARVAGNEIPEVNVTSFLMEQPQADTSPVYEQCDQLPEFHGGMNALMRHLSTNIVYPKESMDANEQGRVLVAFVVEKDGSISDVKIAKSSGFDRLDAEAARVIREMPAWVPGKHEGEVVRARFVLPVNFRLK